MSRSRLLLGILGCVAVALVVTSLAGAVAPVVSITSPASPTTQKSISISFSVDDGTATVECSLDGGAFAGCGSPYTTPTLSDGAHSLAVRATNAGAETGQSSVNWTVDTTGPTLSLPSSPYTVEADESGSTTVTFSASASDASGAGAVSCTPASGSVFAAGTTTVNCNASDSLGNSSSGSFQVLVSDTTPPKITTPADITDNTLNGVDSKTVSYTVTFTGGTGSCAPASGTSFPLGTTTVTCNAQDTSGNSSSKSFSVTLSDITPPTVTAPATQTVESPVGASMTVTYSGVSAADGARTLTPTCSPASGSTFPLGTTSVSCTATDYAGLTGSASFNVVVADTTAPSVAITSGPSGTVSATAGSFSFTTNEGSTTCSLDGAAFAACSSPVAFSSLGDGSHTFQVRATDGASNTGTASRTWSIDLTPPTFTAPSAVVAEANGPAGSVVTYAVTAADNGVPLLPAAVNCSPASGTKFPIATTTVNCTAADALGNVGSTSFTVQVRDTTPPRIAAADITVTAKTPAGIGKDDQPLGSYLQSLRATDLVTPVVRVLNDAPDVLPIGKTAVRLTARDGAGNGARRTIIVTVLPVNQVAPPPPDLTPPADVTGLTATSSDHTITLAWTLPSAKDLASVDVRMSLSSASGTGRLVSRGVRNGVVLRGLKNGVEYRFVVISVDDSGNQSRGAVVLGIPEANLLVSPRAGTKVTGPPLLRWAPVPRAGYYNVQVFKGKTKVLSAWPTRAQLKLSRSWTYADVRHRLALGTYTWYVWPGFGPRGDATYGKLRGKSSFVVVKKAKPFNPA